MQKRVKGNKEKGSFCVAALLTLHWSLLVAALVNAAVMTGLMFRTNEAPAGRSGRHAGGSGHPGGRGRQQSNPELTLILVSHHLAPERQKQFTQVYDLQPTIPCLKSA